MTPPFVSKLNQDVCDLMHELSHRIEIIKSNKKHISSVHLKYLLNCSDELDRVKTKYQKKLKKYNKTILNNNQSKRNIFEFTFYLSSTKKRLKRLNTSFIVADRMIILRKSYKK